MIEAPFGGGLVRSLGGLLQADFIPDAIKRRFNGVLARFTIWSILLKPRPALGVGLLGVEPPGRN